jgi:hypothetical protein
VGHGHLTAGRGVWASGGRLGWRSCLRKGCGRRFQARRYNQRYCREPECLAEVRRWQAAKRQQKCRSQPGVRQRHAEAERQRRKRRASEAQKPSEEETAAVALKDTPAVNSGAWSRSRRHRFMKVAAATPATQHHSASADVPSRAILRLGSDDRPTEKPPRPTNSPKSRPIPSPRTISPFGAILSQNHPRIRRACVTERDGFATDSIGATSCQLVSLCRLRLCGDRHRHDVALLQKRAHDLIEVRRLAAHDPHELATGHLAARFA